MLENDATAQAKARAGGKLVVTTSQKTLWKQKIRKFLGPAGDQKIRRSDLGASRPRPGQSRTTSRSLTSAGDGAVERASG